MPPAPTKRGAYQSRPRPMSAALWLFALCVCSVPWFVGAIVIARAI